MRDVASRAYYGLSFVIIIKSKRFYVPGIVKIGWKNDLDRI
jgi:hypothetical protein